MIKLQNKQRKMIKKTLKKRRKIENNGERDTQFDSTSFKRLVWTLLKTKFWLWLLNIKNEFVKSSGCLTIDINIFT